MINQSAMACVFDVSRNAVNKMHHRMDLDSQMTVRVARYLLTEKIYTDDDHMVTSYNQRANILLKKAAEIDSYRKAYHDSPKRGRRPQLFGLHSLIENIINSISEVLGTKWEKISNTRLSDITNCILEAFDIRRYYKRFQSLLNPEPKLPPPPPETPIIPKIETKKVEKVEDQTDFLFGKLQGVAKFGLSESEKLEKELLESENDPEKPKSASVKSKYADQDVIIEQKRAEQTELRRKGEKEKQKERAREVSKILKEWRDAENGEDVDITWDFTEPSFRWVNFNRDGGTSTVSIESVDENGNFSRDVYWMIDKSRFILDDTEMGFRFVECSCGYVRIEVLNDEKIMEFCNRYY